MNVKAISWSNPSSHVSEWLLVLTTFVIKIFVSPLVYHSLVVYGRFPSTPVLLHSSRAVAGSSTRIPSWFTRVSGIRSVFRFGSRVSSSGHPPEQVSRPRVQRVGSLRPVCLFLGGYGVESSGGLCDGTTTRVPPRPHPCSDFYRWCSVGTPCSGVEGRLISTR